MLVVSEKCWPSGGGAELATQLILDLIREEYDITVLTGTREPKRSDRIKYVYCNSLDAPNKIQLWRNLVAISGHSWFDKLVRSSDLAYVPRISYPIIPLVKRRKKKVIVHLHDYQPISYTSIVFGHQERKLNFFGEMHDTLRLELLDRHNALRALASTMASPLNASSRFLIQQADSVVCVSKRQSDIITTVIPELVRKVTMIYNPAPPIPFRAAKSWHPAITYVGGSSYIKGLQIFLRASVKLLRNKTFRISLAGLSEADRLDLLAASRKIGGSYAAFGRLSQEEILELYSTSSALVVPSISEECAPYALIESMLSGTIPLASRIGGIPELVSGTFAEGLLFRAGDVEELLQRMDFVLSLSPEHLLSIGRQLRDETQRKLDPEKLKEHYLQEFNKE